MTALDAWERVVLHQLDSAVRQFSTLPGFEDDLEAFMVGINQCRQVMTERRLRRLSQVYAESEVYVQDNDLETILYLYKLQPNIAEDIRVVLHDPSLKRFEYLLESRFITKLDEFLSSYMATFRWTAAGWELARRLSEG